MPYRTKTYIAGEWTGDSAAIEQLYKWNDGDRWSFHFVDAHANRQCYDSSKPCTIKDNLRDRMRRSKVFVLVVGNDTVRTRKGSCAYQICSNRQYYYTRGYVCTVIGKTYSTQSFIEYECDMARKAYINGDVRIVVLYNSTSVDKSKYPVALKDIGIHKEMRSYFPLRGCYDYDYYKVKNAIEG